MNDRLKVAPAPGTPAGEMMRLADEERACSDQEQRLLARGAQIEGAAREAQARLDQLRAALQQLAGTASHADAEVAFRGSLQLVIPPHVTSPATKAALELRRQTLGARLQALQAEQQTVEGRAAQLEVLRQQLGQLEVLAGQATARAMTATQRSEAQAPTPPPQRVPANLRGAQPQPPAQEGAERRVNARTALQAEVSLSSESNFYSGFSGDLSETGLFVATYGALSPPGTPVIVSLALPGVPPLRIEGVVRWVRDSQDRTAGVFPGMGIGFQNLGQAEAMAIQGFLKRREPMFWSEG